MILKQISINYNCSLQFGRQLWSYEQSQLIFKSIQPVQQALCQPDTRQSIISIFLHTFLATRIFVYYLGFLLAQDEKMLEKSYILQRQAINYTKASLINIHLCCIVRFSLGKDVFESDVINFLGNLPMNFNIKARKRISFTPIMLTSKSIRPVDRSDYEQMRNQRRFSGVRKETDELTNYIFRNSSDCLNNSTYVPAFNKDQAYNRMNSPLDAEENVSLKLARKMTTPTVVKVQFQDESGKTKKRKLRLPVEVVQAQQDKAQKSKAFSAAGAKTYEQFTRIAKIHPHKQNIISVRDEIDQEWGRYLDKYYLNIRKVRPVFLKQKGEQQPQRLINISEISPTRNADIAEMRKLKVSIHLRAKKQQKADQISPVGADSSEDGIDNPFQMSVYKKIEQNIYNHRSTAHKKHFVFGMSETNGRMGQVTLKNKFDTYRDFIFRVNFTNGLYVKPRQQSEKPLKFYVGFGNNSSIIKGIMRRRFWWQLVDKISDDTNFVWTQLKISDYLKKQKRNICKLRINRFSHHVLSKEDPDSSSILQNGIEQPQKNDLMYGEDLRLWQRYQSKHRKHEEKGFEHSIIRRVTGLLKKKGIALIENSSKIKMHNHLQSNYFLGNKKALFYSLRKYYQLLKLDPFTKIPLTFHITQGIQDPQFQRFLKQFQYQSQKRKVDKQFRNIWIIKPGELTNRGRGITVCSTLDQIKNRLKSKQRNTNGSNRTFIIQKYIQRPLLYQRRKFDIRHYMAITCHNAKIKGYWYAEGYIRTTSSQYNIKNTKDLFNHLTNDAVQKNGQDYGKFQKGNKVSYHQFQKYLTANVSQQIDFFNQILPKMKELATDSIRATYSILDPQRKQHNFELFGLDFMLDQSLNVFLIQVNTNPCLQTSCPLLTKIITPLIQNVFKLCLDPLFPPPYQWPPQKKYTLGQDALQQNKFSIVFDQNQQGLQLKQLYRNVSKIDEKMGDIYEQDQQYQDQQKEWNDEQQTGIKK